MWGNAIHISINARGIFVTNFTSMHFYMLLSFFATVVRIISFYMTFNTLTIIDPIISVSQTSYTIFYILKFSLRIFLHNILLRNSWQYYDNKFWYSKNYLNHRKIAEICPALFQLRTQRHSGRKPVNGEKSNAGTFLWINR